MLSQTLPFADAYELLRQCQIRIAITEEFFNQLIADFKMSYLQSKNYEQRLKWHRNPIMVKKEVLQELYKYHLRIQSRQEINCYYPEEASNEFANVRIASIMEEDIRIAHYEAMVQYCRIRSKDIYIMAAHYAEFLAIDQLIMEIRLSINDEEANTRLPNIELVAYIEKSYLEALNDISSFGAHLEKVGGATLNYDESAYRAPLIAHLNALSKYVVCAEAYNRLGKTDILIKDKNGHTILIAECKLWNGEAKLKEAIDQLLNNYLTQTDDKAALIIFNRDAKNYARIEQKAFNVLINHECRSGSPIRRSDGSYAFLFSHPCDQNRIIKLELILFHFAAARIN